MMLKLFSVMTPMMSMPSIAELNHCSVSVSLNQVSVPFTEDGYKIYFLLRIFSRIIMKAMSTEKEQFDDGIKKCEKILIILLPQNVFKVLENKILDRMLCMMSWW